MRVVVYAEGGREARPPALGTAPGESLKQQELGPAHEIVARLFEQDGRARPRFDAPLLLRCRVASGSDLLKPASLRKLLTWPLPETTPDFAVVLVDGDGDESRYACQFRKI
jgi:hypothetical protein